MSIISMDSRMNMEKVTDIFNTADRLVDICINYFVNNMDKYMIEEDEEKGYTFVNNLALPAEIWEPVIHVYQKTKTLRDETAYLFHNVQNTPLNSVILDAAKITDKGFLYFMTNKPRNLEVNQCDSLTPNCINIINENSQNLECMKFVSGQSTQIPFYNPDLRITAPKLEKVVINQYQLSYIPVENAQLSACITFLDLSECHLIGENLPHLSVVTHLVLYNVAIVTEMLDWIMKLKTLIHLDISRSEENNGKFTEPNKILHKLVLSLPALESLDISGTNLAGTGAAALPLDEEAEGVVDIGNRVMELCDIPGLCSRVNTPLKFLGLYGTHYGACKRHHIPADKISGDHDEEQLLTAALIYGGRPSVMVRVLNDLYYLFRNDKIRSPWISLSLILNSMEHHANINHIQIAGSASLFYVVKGKDKEQIGGKLSQRIITAVVVAMENHASEGTIIRNSCLTLCQFSVPYDVMFIYERLVMILISSIVIANDVFVVRIGTYLLNSLACQVGKTHRQFLGDCGIIRCMLQIITERLENDICDDIMAIAWSTMWNVTDETPLNCKMFLDDVGLLIFMKCLKKYPEKPDLLRNMMGLLGNVAEVKGLRHHLMDRKLVVIFYSLLYSLSDGIEVSYNAAGVLAHLASDGPAAWTLDEPKRSDILERIAEACESWDIHSERNINYRSFGPILSLLYEYHTPQCQHWAIWALANLTTVYPEKYCTLLELEGGLLLVRTVSTLKTAYSRIRELAQIVLDNCADYFNGSFILDVTDY